MKTLICLFATLMLALGSCTEEIIIEKIVHDSIPYAVPGPVQFAPTFVPQSVDSSCQKTDTTNVEIKIKEIFENGEFKKDTVLAVTTACYLKITVRGKVSIPPKIVYSVRDSLIYEDSLIFIDRPVPYPVAGPTGYVDTTIVEQRVVYETTEYVWIGRTVFYIPEDLMVIYNKYFSDGAAYNKILPGGPVVVQYVPSDKLPGFGWHSTSYLVAGGQWLIELDENLTQDLAFTCLYRELSRMQMGKRYSNNQDEIMNVLFDPARLKYNDPDSKKKPYLDVLFN